jgi:hypothetical protein
MVHDAGSVRLQVPAAQKIAISSCLDLIVSSTSTVIGNGAAQAASVVRRLVSLICARKRETETWRNEQASPGKAVALGKAISRAPTQLIIKRTTNL